MLNFILGISICLNFILGIIIFIYIKIKSKTKNINNFLNLEDVNQNWENFFK